MTKLLAESDLNIHVAIGAGLIYGYYVGGDKWDYLIDGPVLRH